MAGSWSSLTTHVGTIGEVWKPTVGLEYEFTADASDASVPDKETDSISGAIGAVAVIFDGTTAPNSVTVSVKDKYGAVRATGTLTATGYLDLDGPVVFVPGALTISVSGNSTNSAKAKVILVIF